MAGLFAPAPAASMRPFSNLYVHVPFCRHKCGYCDFNAYAGMDRLMPDYVEGLLVELAHARERLPFAALETVYLGGGTPSLLPAPLVARLLDGIAGIFDLAPGAEVTLEANPASTDPERLLAWRQGGVERLSLGVQGFDLRALAVLERRTDGVQAVRAYTQARQAGFQNISLDLIYAVPTQTIASWLETLRRAVELRPEHISCYCLAFEEGTLLHRRLERGLVAAVDPDRQWELLEASGEVLAAAGFERYEVSSWARPGRRSRHNRAYWACRPVYGAGAGAHTYASSGDVSWRWWNVARPREYLARLPHPVLDGEELTGRRVAAERVMLGLRTVEGVDMPDGFATEIAELQRLGLVRLRRGRVTPTDRGLDLHTQVALAVL